MKIIIDTSIFIDYFRGGKVWERFLNESKPDINDLYLPTIVVFEIFSGKSTKNAHIAKEIKGFLKKFQKIEFTEEIALRAGELFRDTTRDLDIPDYIIAASALEIGGTVLTLNKKHFEKVPHLTLYSL